jgi:hypothetical protein
MREKIKNPTTKKARKINTPPPSQVLKLFGFGFKP